MSLTFHADIDSDLKPSERQRAAQEIDAELAPEHASDPHPSLSDLPELQFSSLLEQAIAQKAANLPWEGGVDLSRYEALEAPTTSGVDEAAGLARWRNALQRAYASSTHLETRLTNLALLEEFGKNAWLVGNSQLEDLLRTLERELVQARERTDEVNKARKLAQESVRGEMEGLDEAWRKGVERVIQVELAAEEVRRDILERRRDAAAQA